MSVAVVVLRVVRTLLFLIVCAGATGPARAQARPDSIRFRNPPTLPAARGYSQIVEVPPGSRLVFLAGQVPVDSTGQVVGIGDFRAQAIQVFENLQRALAAAGMTFRDLVKLNFYVLDVSQLGTLRDVRDRYVNTQSPPVSTLVEVRRLFRPEVLLEVEAVAAAPK